MKAFPRRAGQNANYVQLTSTVPFSGPYIGEDTNTRPVPTAFA